MRVIDVHQHLWPQAFVTELSLRSRPPLLHGGLLTTHEGTFRIDLDENALASRLASLDSAGIDIAIVSLQPTIGFESLPVSEREPLVAVYHEGIAELVAASGGRLRAFAAGEFVEGFDGTCIGATRLLDLAALEAVLDPLEQAGGLLFVHPDGAPPATTSLTAWWSAVTTYTAQMQAAYFAWIAHGAPRWPELRVVFAILAGGAPFQLERLRSRGAETRPFTSAHVYFDTSSYGRRSLELCLAAFGVDRLVHGSDFPVIDPDPTLSAIRALGKETFNAICSHNPEALLRPDQGRADRRPVSQRA